MIKFKYSIKISQNPLDKTFYIVYNIIVLQNIEDVWDR